MSTKELAIQTSSVTKRFGTFEAVSQVTLEIPKGIIYAMIGPNGAGKSTYIKMLVGLLQPDNGTIRLCGHDIQYESEEAKQSFGYVSDDPSPYEYLSGEEFLALTGNMRGMGYYDIKRKIHELVPLFSLEPIIRQSMSQYSRGNKQKIAFLAAIMAEPEILIIDEPIVGLDPDSIDIFGQMLIAFKNAGGTVFFVTHTLQFAQKYADKVGLMKKGELITEKLVRSTTDMARIYEFATEKHE